MTRDRFVHAASFLVFATGAFWGLYWLPVRALQGAGLGGAWGTLAITVAALVLLSPVLLWRGAALRGADPMAIISVALGGAAFALYSGGFVYGRVALIILLYFLTPVWSTLIGRYLMGWPTPRMRIAAIVVGIAGLMVMLGARGEVPLPRGLGEWMALAAGILWSASTTGIRAKAALGPPEAAFVFAAGAVLAGLVMAPLLEAPPTLAALADPLRVLGIALLAGGIWWGLSIVALLWAAVRLEPARVGILLMAEVLVGAVSAAVLAGERLQPLEIAGGALVLCAGLLEVWPVRPPRGRAGAVRGGP